jgi:hypothetical protein
MAHRAGALASARRAPSSGRRATIGVCVLVAVATLLTTLVGPDVAGAAGRCVRTTSPSSAGGPSATIESVADANDGSPAVSMVRYPRPERATGGSNPWSQWGQGLVLRDGRFLSAIGDHRGRDGDSYLFVYEPSTKKLTRFADVSSLTEHEPGDWGYGKVHGQFVAGKCDTAWFATYWGTRDDIVYNDRYRGDALFRIDTSSLDTKMVDVPVEEHGIPSLAGGPTPGLLYGEAVDPSADGSSAGHELGAFFVYDTVTEKVIHRSDDMDHGTFRNVLVDGSGRAYVAGENGRLLRYVPGADKLEDAGVRLPGGGALRASTVPAPDGTVYGVTQDGKSPTEALFALAPDGKVRSLGEAKGYTAALALSRDGSRLYYVPGAHGDAWNEGTPVIEVDTQTGKQRTLVELNPLAEEHLKLTLGGSYNVALDRKRNVLYVGANAGSTHDRPWGEIVLAVVPLGP